MNAGPQPHPGPAALGRQQPEHSRRATDGMERGPSVSRHPGPRGGSLRSRLRSPARATPGLPLYAASCQPRRYPSVLRCRRVRVRQGDAGSPREQGKQALAQGWTKRSLTWEGGLGAKPCGVRLHRGVSVSLVIAIRRPEGVGVRGLELRTHGPNHNASSPTAGPNG